MRLSWNTLSSLVISILLAVLVWLVAVNERNPFEDRALPGAVTVVLENTPPGLLIRSGDRAQVTLTVRGPSEVLNTLTTEDVHVFADLSGFTEGTREVELRWEFRKPVEAVRVIDISPTPSIRIVLERQVTREVRVRLQRAGEPAPGYDVGQERLAFTTATVTGPASAVERVSELIANVSVANLKSNFNQAVTLQPVDSEGQSVTEARPSPLTVQVQVPITQKEGFRDVAVKLVYRGQVAPGYRLDSYIVSPPIVTVSSSDRDLVSALPGFVETEPIDIAGATDDITQQLALVLPQGVFPVGEPAVLVQFIVEPITDTVSVQRLVEVQNLGPGLIARVLPETVEVLVTGPLPVLRRLTGEDVRIVVNVQNLTAGRYQLTPEVLFSRESLRADTIQPGTIEVELVRGTPPTRTPTRAPLPTRTATPITTPTFTPAPPADTETPTPTPGQ